MWLRQVSSVTLKSAAQQQLQRQTGIAVRQAATATADATPLALAVKAMGH
jgi:hypothetical protein